MGLGARMGLAGVKLVVCVRTYKEPMDLSLSISTWVLCAVVCGGSTFLRNFSMVIITSSKRDSTISISVTYYGPYSCYYIISCALYIYSIHWWCCWCKNVTKQNGLIDALRFRWQITNFHFTIKFCYCALSMCTYLLLVIWYVARSHKFYFNILFYYLCRQYLL